jgi:hypothetical protein
VLPTDGLEEEALAAEAEISRQTRDSEEFAPLLRSMEEQYDLNARDELVGAVAGGDLPDAEEIGAQIERFLAQMDDRGGEAGR